ncbi:MAG TPA: hypothetical protein VGX92_21450 [Pyrinomonadaceae bacterium]|jgi:hypothetical protein|nr:hypothetical protein [Pyrinomonadaceae bacterium]
MENPTVRLNRQAFKRSALALIFMAAIGMAVWLPRSIRSQQSTPRVENKTQAVQVVSLVLEETNYILSLKNISDKSINGYSLGMGARSMVDAELTTVGRVIAPGATFQERIPASKLRPSSASGSLEPTITILAVLFEDSTGEGDAPTIARHKARRAGVKGQLGNILPLIKATLEQPDSELPAALKKLKQRVASLSETPGDGLPPASTSGLQSAKQDVLMMLENLQPSSDIRAELSEIKEQLEKRAGKL